MGLSMAMKETGFNALFKITVDKNGLLELETANLSERSFHRIRQALYEAKRVIISTKSGHLGTALCTTIDDGYQGGGEVTDDK